MHDVLNRNLFVVKEHVGIFKAANNYDIHDPDGGEIIIECREENLGIITRILRFTDYKRMTPFDVQLRTPDGAQVLQVQRGVSFFLSKVVVRDENGRELGFFKQKSFSIGGAFDIVDGNDQVVCSLKGKWTGWDFRFVHGDDELAQVSKKWAGLGKELFTSADNYVLEISPSVAVDSPVRQLIVAAVMTIDMVLKES